MSLCANDPCIQDVDVKTPITWNVPWPKRVKHHFNAMPNNMRPLNTPLLAVVAGPSGSGKTSFLMSLIEHKSTAFTPEPSRIILCYKQFQPAYEKLLSRTDVQLVQGCKGYTLCPDTRTLLIIDDFSSESEEANIGGVVFRVQSPPQHVRVLCDP